MNRAILDAFLRGNIHFFVCLSLLSSSCILYDFQSSQPIPNWNPYPNYPPKNYPPNTEAELIKNPEPLKEIIPQSNPYTMELSSEILKLLPQEDSHVAIWPSTVYYQKEQPIRFRFINGEGPITWSIQEVIENSMTRTTNIQTPDWVTEDLAFNTDSTKEFF